MNRLAYFLVVATMLSICQPASVSLAAATANPKTFDSPEQAAEALITAAEKFDVSALEEIFGTAGRDIYQSGELPQDRERAHEFAREARVAKNVIIDPTDPRRAHLNIGPSNWPLPVPIVKSGDKWFFDAAAGREELLLRRIGANELDAIRICRGYVEAQREYALRPRKGYATPQYAQRLISTPGHQDGLAWRNTDGTWGGPVGEKIAHAIEQGYVAGAKPYHGYYFKILKGQGPAARLGELNFVVQGVMIGGFALVAAPAEYGVTGLKTFIVSHEGRVYERDFGATSLQAFAQMERFNPDSSWTAVAAETP